MQSAVYCVICNNIIKIIAMFIDNIVVGVCTINAAVVNDITMSITMPIIHQRHSIVRPFNNNTS